MAKNGGDAKVSAFSPSHMALVSVIEYPDEESGKRAVFVSVHSPWDLAEWTAMIREANA